MHDDGFVEDLRANPNDEWLRLVYADWFDDRGDLRGDFLRIEYRMWGLPEMSKEYASLRRQLKALAQQIDVRWRAVACRVHLETGPWHEDPQRCPLNVVGPFYTCGDCLACEAPECEAPDLLAPLGKRNCTTYFIRQPQTVKEIERACRAALVCCVADLRYGGTDPKIIARLGNNPLYCDYLLADDSPRLVAAPPQPRSYNRTMLSRQAGQESPP